MVSDLVEGEDEGARPRRKSTDSCPVNYPESLHSPLEILQQLGVDESVTESDGSPMLPQIKEEVF